MQDNLKKYNQLIAKALLLFTSVIVFVVFFQLYQTKNDDYKRLNSKLTAEASRFKTLTETTGMASEYESRFNHYMPVKQYETENRLYLIDRLQTIRTKHNLSAINYSFGSQIPYDYKDGLISERGLKVNVSNITLSMKLKHEQQLIAVLRDIDNIKSAIHLLSSCELKRLAAANVQFAVENIDAQCHLKWFTFKVL
ncbi:MAG: hypothetical protein OEY36_03695 [Gammaproteobacteria bacterium]|nr:hypothetical protein [Gammaproteobacteria bacterium]